jgi:uncharacterized protein YjiS (DUF1127 family)
MTEVTIQAADGIRTEERRIGDWFRWRLHAVAREHRARGAAKDLAQYNDRLLRDIGLERDQVEFAVRGKLRQAEASRWRI